MTAQQLRNSILQEAISGRLIPQDSNDEPASVLIKHICEEKAKLVKEGKFKEKELLSEPVNDDEKLFDIPCGWEWIRLNNLYVIARGGSPRPIKEYLTNSSDGVNWIKIGDTEKGGKYINSTHEKIKPQGVSKSRMIHKGDFLLTNSMSFGRPYISNIEGCIHDGWLVISPTFGLSFDPDYLFYLLSSPFAYDQFSGKVAGAVVQNLNSDKVATSVFPIPPLAEQKRIVAKIEELLLQVEKYGKAQSELDELNAKLPIALRQSILLEAIQGKLVKQDDNDKVIDFASVLRKAKEQAYQIGIIKKCDKNLKDIDESEYPFDIPKTWQWLRLSDVANMYTGDSINAEEKLSKYTNVKGRVYIGTKDVKFDHKVDYQNGVAIPEKYQSNFRLAPKGSILLCVEGGSAGRKIGVVDQDVHFGNKLCCFSPYIDINAYLYYYLQCPLFTEVFKSSITGIIGGVSIGVLKDLLIPLPPMEEQKRIVSKIEQLFLLLKN